VTTGAPSSEFDAAIALDEAGPGRLTGHVHPGWDIAGNANGGYLLALAGAGLRRVAGRPDPVTITAHYLSPAPAGPIEVTGEVAKQGRRFTTVAGSLRSSDGEGREILRVVATFGDLAEAHADQQLLDGGPPELPEPASCARHVLPEGSGLALMERLDLRLRPDDAGFVLDRRSGRAEMRGWLAFADGRPFDTLALLLASDAFPPAVFNLDLPRGWVPTVELTVHVRAVPAPGPLRCRFSTRFIQGGFLEEDGEVWDERGVLVAQCRQLALAPRA
jgi:hypothetical protein